MGNIMRIKYPLSNNNRKKKRCLKALIGEPHANTIGEKLNGHSRQHMQSTHRTKKQRKKKEKERTRVVQQQQ